MVIWFLLIITFAQIAVRQGQEVPRQPQIIRTAPVVVPCLECLKNSGMNLASLLKPSACGCREAPYQGEDPGTCQPSSQLESQVETGGEADCCCFSTDNNQSNVGGPSFSVGMLAPLASMLTSFMSGLGNTGNEAVTINFDGQTCSSNPGEEYNPGGPQCNIVPYDNEASNQSITNTPSSPVESVTSGPAIYNTQLPQWFPVAGNKHNFVACQCYKKSRKGVPDIEEDSLYAFAHNNPGKKCSCNPSINQDTAYNRAFTHNGYTPDISLNQQQIQMFRNDIHQQSVQKDNNLIQTPPTGNPEFDSISRLSALFSSQKNNFNLQTSNREPDIMPCQCCC